MVKKLRVKDPDRPIESYPGYLGLYHDGSYMLGAVLQPLLAFPWDEYRDFDPEPKQASKRTIKLSAGPKNFRVTFDRDEINLIGLMDKLPTVIVKSDEGGGDFGPGSGGILTIWENKKYTLRQISGSIKSCLRSLSCDFELVKKRLE